MQTNHTLSEDVEPPSTDSRRSDFKGYRASTISIIHEFPHGRNPISKTYPLKKKRLERNHSLSSCFVPSISRSAEFNTQFGERLGLFDEDDEYPPSAPNGIESRNPGLLRYPEITGRDHRHLFPRSKKKYSVSELRRKKCLTNEAGARTAMALRIASWALAFFHRSVSYVSRFRSVPSGRLGPPGTILC